MGECVIMSILQDNELTMDTVEQLVRTTFQNWRSLNFADVDLAIAVIFFIGEALPVCFLLFANAINFQFLLV